MRERQCNSEKALIFAACILHKKKTIKFMTNIKLRIWKRLECWKAGHYCALVKDVDDAAMEDGWGTARGAPFNVKSVGKKYDLMFKSGK